MQTTVVTIPAEKIVDRQSFHDVFQEALSFPCFYGRNMNAWIDCLTFADDAEAGMLSPTVRPGELLTVRIDEAASLRERCPEIYEDLISCTAFVNFRRIEAGQQPVLALILGGNFPQPY
ncbi:MAG: barnase inhibitor [Alphaproteobacteria bacterium HGW-Alphaproteobacteria-17]|nr:MAG: barnase inhibitor [Alphaproteobacteria bacterium HGW-Alphaproteobacteria-17]